MRFSPLQLLWPLFPMCFHLPVSSVEPGAKVWAQGCCSGLLNVEQSTVIVYSACWHVPEWHLPFFPTVSHCRFMLAPGFGLIPGLVCRAAQCLSPACPSSGHPSFPFWMLPSTSIFLSFALLISDPFYFILSSGLLWIPALSVKVLLRPLLPHAVENLIEAKIHHIYSRPLPTSPVTLPEKEIWLVWHNSLFTNPHWLFPFPLLSSESQTDCLIIWLNIFQGVKPQLTAPSLPW